jgi:serine/threonine protein kinase
VATKEALEIVQKEIKVLQKFEGPYIVKIIASDIAAARLHGSSGGVEAFILLELCPGGHLLNRLNDRKGIQLPPSSIYRIFGQILLAVKSLHASDPIVTHRDLKLENILFGGDGNVRLCDFGSCVFGHVTMRTPEERSAAEEVIERTTTQMYRSPEMVDLYLRSVLTEKTDIWALGCILYALCFLVHPFQDAGSLGILSAKIQIPSHSSVHPDVHVILLRMLDVSLAYHLLSVYGFDGPNV